MQIIITACVANNLFTEQNNAKKLLYEGDSARVFLIILPVSLETHTAGPLNGGPGYLSYL